jgi:hypothetical protein
MSEFLLLYDVVRTAKSPDDVMLSFLESTSKKTKTRAKLSLFVVFVSAVFWLIQGFTLYYEVGVPRALPIIVVNIAIIISLGYRRRKPVLWKQYKGIRRHFSGEVRQEVLNTQKYKCVSYYLIFVACTSPLFAFTIILS